MYFRRDARPRSHLALRGSEAEIEAAVKALSYDEFKQMREDIRRRRIVRKKRLHHRCLDRRCRRARACTAGETCCVCFNMAGIGRKHRKRIGLLRRRRRWRI